MTLLQLPSASGATAGREQRILEAALRCFARWGVSKTSFDDVAREAGYSRATAYRFFPGGREALLQAVTRAEVAAFTAAVLDAAGQAAGDGLEAVLVAGMSTAGRLFTTHPALQFVLRHEPEVVLPRLAFAHLDEVLHDAGELARPLLSRFCGGDEEAAGRLGEWSARLLLSYAFSPAEGVDIADPQSIRTLVRTFILPGTSTEGAA